MKKSIFLLSVALGLLTACDPIKDEADFNVDNISSEQLLQGATFEQFSGVKNEDGSMTYTPAADGNYIKYSDLLYLLLRYIISRQMVLA